MILGEMIHKAREKRGMTQVELGLAIGIPTAASAQVCISRYESGKAVPQRRLGLLIKVLKLPAVSVAKALLTRY